MIRALVPAKSKSQGVPNKNIRELEGHPLLAWSIKAGLLVSRIGEVVVTTDSEEYKEIALAYGATVMLYPETGGEQGYLPPFLEQFPDTNLVVLLRPTSPLRKPELIQQAISKVVNNPEYSSLRSGYYESEPYQKCFTWDEVYLKPITSFEDTSKPRQAFQRVYHPNGYVDILKASVIKEGKLYGEKIAGFQVPDVGEIDEADDFNYVEWRLAKYGSVLLEYLRNVK